MSRELIRPAADLGCPDCGNAEGNTTFQAREMMFGTRERFTYAACGACGTLRLIDVPDDMSRYYGGAYYSTRRDFRRWVRQHHSVYRLAHLVMLGRLPDLPEWWPSEHVDRSTSILDVGSGAGNLLLRLQSLGFTNLLGIDPFNPAGIRYGGGLRVLKQTLEDTQGRFEVVVMNHSFEHMPEPLAVLRRVRSLVAHGGELVIRTPIAGSWAMREYGADWVQLDAPRHLFVHSEGGLRRLAEKVGLRVDKMAYDSTALQFWGSEHYRRGLPFVVKKPIFTRREMQEFERRAADLNRRGEGDQAWLHLSRVGPHV